MTLAFVLAGAALSDGLVTRAAGDISKGQKRETVFALVSSAENSSLDYAAQYRYIEDIGDGRGYTAGIVGFTSGTGDLLKVVRLYAKKKPTENGLKSFIPALENVNGTDSHKGLGNKFVKAWKRACKDKEMIAAQNAIVDKMYLKPAVRRAKKDGLSALGQYIYYDALVVHGPGGDEESFGGIRKAAAKRADTPAEGGNEEAWLNAFLDAREKIMLREEAHSDLSRIAAQRKFLAEGNFDLALPLSWTMYGDEFVLR